MTKPTIKKNTLCNLADLKELVKVMKEEKIFSLKANGLEIQLSQMAFVPDVQVVDIVGENPEEAKIKEAIEKSKTSIEDINDTSKEYENSTSDPNKDPICGPYSEEELFR